MEWKHCYDIHRECDAHQEPHDTAAACVDGGGGVFKIKSNHLDGAGMREWLEIMEKLSDVRGRKENLCKSAAGGGRSKIQSQDCGILNIFLQL